MTEEAASSTDSDWDRLPEVISSEVVFTSPQIDSMLPGRLADVPDHALEPDDHAVQPPAQHAEFVDGPDPHAVGEVARGDVRGDDDRPPASAATIMRRTIQ